MLYWISCPDSYSLEKELDSFLTVEIERPADLVNVNDKIRLQREIEVADRQIDQLVYQLYGLTKEEIKIVEEAVGK